MKIKTTGQLDNKLHSLFTTKTLYQKSSYFINLLILNDFKWTPIYSILAQSIFHPKHYTIIKNTLLENNIIECDNKYSTIGMYAQKYRIHKDYIGEVIEKEINNKNLENKIEQAELFNKNKLDENYNKNKKGYDWVIKNQKKLKINVYNALSFAKGNNLPHQTIKQIETFNKREKYTIKDGRLYYKLTNIDKRIKKFLVGNYVELDIPNSHPFMLCFILKKYITSDEYFKYKQLVESGNFYSYLEEKYNIEDAKNKFFIMLNGDFSFYQFQKEFPLIYSFLQEYKKNTNIYKKLCRIEADYIYSVCSALCDKKITCYTIQDSFIINEKDYEYVIETMKEKMEKFEIEINPKIKLL